MSEYPNYRISVEVVLKHGDKVLVTKRSEESVVAPGVWNVPAGKVKYEETPLEGLYREAKEETGLDVKMIRELNVRTFQGHTAKGDIYRVVFTYLVEAENDDLSNFAINEEHSACAWVNKQDLSDEKYTSLSDEVREMIEDVL